MLKLRVQQAVVQKQEKAEWENEVSFFSEASIPEKNVFSLQWAMEHGTTLMKGRYCKHAEMANYIFICLCITVLTYD